MDRHEERESASEHGDVEHEVTGATIDTGVSGAGDDHPGLEGVRDIRPHSAREDIRLT